MCKYTHDRLVSKTGFAWVTLGIGLLATVFSSLQVKQGIEQDAASQFTFACDRVTLKIQERLGAYALILRGGAALFSASKVVDRQEWRTYIETLRATGSVPGVQGIGFVQLIPPHRLAAHITRIRSEGFPGYTVRPPGKRSIYTSIVYLEPFRGQNLLALGTDMYADQVRRAAMERAGDNGQAALSGKVELALENGVPNAQAGIFMYVPVYRKGAPEDTVGQRRAALIGWTYSPYRMNELMSGILLDWAGVYGNSVDLAIYDGRNASPSALLFDSNPTHMPNLRSLFYQQRMIDFNGQNWLLVFDHTGKPFVIGYAPAWIALTAGIAFSCLLFVLMLSEINTRAKAIQIATKLTEEIRHHEEALKASEDKILLLLNSTAEAIYGVDMEGNCTFCNDSCLRLLGYAHAEELLGKNMHWQIHGKHADGTYFPVEECRIFQAFNKGECMHVDDEVLWRFDGTYFPAEYWSYPQIQNGVIVGAVVSFLDITERKRMQDNLALSELEMRTTLYNIGDAVISLDTNGCVLLMNPVAEKLTGWNESEAHGKLLEEVFCIVHEETRSKLDNPVVMASNAGEIVRMTAHTLLLARDGTERSIANSAAPIFAQDNTIIGFILVFRDLAKERESEEATLNQLAIIETYNGLVALANMDEKLIYINAGGIKMLGAAKPEEILGKKITDFIDQTNLKRASDEAIPTYIKDRVWNGERTLKRLDGTNIPVAQTIFTICGARGDPKHIGIIMMDISPQKELQEKLLMTEKLEVMGRLVADVAHDLNNPLAIIIGRTQLMLSHMDQQPSPLNGHLETVLQSARRCTTILSSNLLTYSRTISLQEVAVSLPDLILEAIGNVNYQYDMSAIEVAVNCNLPSHTEIVGNKDALLAVFVNLIRNARQAMINKGNLTIGVAKENESHLRIEIHDTGIGMTEEQLNSLFQPFITGWKKDKGTGLGLATSLGIIQTHGGKIWAESEKGKGTKFTILLPYKN